MLLYHGSTVVVEQPQIINLKSFLDFGAGFYTTTSLEQAERWAKIKMRRENKEIAYVSVYDFDYEDAKAHISTKRFSNADMEWLLFVVNNRRGMPPAIQADLYIGPVADDNVYQSIRFFETGILDAEETVRRLKTEVLHDQWTFCTERALSFCKFVDYREVR